DSLCGFTVLMLVAVPLDTLRPIIPRETVAAFPVILSTRLPQYRAEETGQHAGRSSIRQHIGSQASEYVTTVILNLAEPIDLHGRVAFRIHVGRHAGNEHQRE